MIIYIIVSDEWNDIESVWGSEEAAKDAIKEYQKEVPGARFHLVKRVMNRLRA